MLEGITFLDKNLMEFDSPLRPVTGKDFFYFRQYNVS
jgi:hypothetical protein